MKKVTGSLPALVEAWRACPLDARPFVLPGDRELLAADCKRWFGSYDEFAESAFQLSYARYREEMDNLQLGLIPAPYNGNLAKAKIFFLMLNPGFLPGNYFFEQVPEFRAARIACLRQENAAHEFPFTSFDPRFAWHPGALYWTKKFKPVLEELNTKPGRSYAAALKILSQGIAYLQHIPYHSASGPKGLHGELRSTQLAKQYVHDVLIPRAQADDALIVVVRKREAWNRGKEQFPTHKNIIQYRGVEARAGHLTKTALRRILDRLND